MTQNINKKWRGGDPRRGALIGLVTNFLIRSGMKPLAAAQLATPMADGMAMNAWHLAEQYWIPKRKLIPRSDWEALESAGYAEILFQCELAERRTAECCGSSNAACGKCAALVDDPDAPFIYVSGTEEACGYFFKDQEQRINAGKASADARKARTGSALPQGASNHPARTAPERTPSGRSNDAEQNPNGRSENAERTPSTPERAPSETELFVFISSFPVLKNLSLSESIVQRFKALPKAAREREIEGFAHLVEQFSDPGEIAEVVRAVEVRGKDIRGNPITSLMGYLQHAFPQELALLRAEKAKVIAIELKKSAAQAKLERERVAKEREAQEFRDRERAFLEAFANEDAQAQAFRQFGPPWAKDKSSELARQFAINAWWESARDGPGQEVSA